MGPDAVVRFYALGSVSYLTGRARGVLIIESADTTQVESKPNVIAATQSAVVSVAIGSLSGTVSPRSIRLDDAHVRRLMSVDELQPIIVHRGSMCVIDGVHRVRAAQLLGQTHIAARFFDGSIADAFVVAVLSNTSHGLQLPYRDRVAAAQRILISFPGWSNRGVAVVTALSAKTVAKIRRTSEDIPLLNTRVGRDGRARPVDSTAGRRRAVEYLIANPQASLRAIAAAAGISLGTAHDVRARLGSDGEVSPAGGQASLTPPGRPLVGERDSEVVVTQAIGRSQGSVSEIPDPTATLSADPSLRMSESGRLLLRLLNGQTLFTARQDQIVSQLPSHVLPIVRVAAYQWIQVWQGFVTRLDIAIADTALHAS